VNVKRRQVDYQRGGGGGMEGVLQTAAPTRTLLAYVRKYDKLRKKNIRISETVNR
jgi:hypothetical protein